MLFLVVLGGAAVLEVHRALHSGNKDVRDIQRKEQELRRQLQDLQRELQQAKSQRELTEREVSQLSQINAALLHDKEALEAQSSTLQQTNEVLAQKAEALLQRQQQLEQAEEVLRQENANLLLQFDRLKIKYEEESSSFHQQLTELKQQVSGALQRFASGELSADALLAFLSGMGFEVQCRPEGVEGLAEALNSARSAEERLQLLDKVELKVDDSWVHQLRLSSCPDRAARLLMAGREAAPATSTTAALTYQQQQPKKISTPTRDTVAAATKVPLLKLPTSAASVPAAATAAAAIKAAAPAEMPEAPQQAPAALPAASASPAASEEVQVLRPVQASSSSNNKMSSLRFLPKKASSKSVVKLPSPRLEMELSLGENAAPNGGGKGPTVRPRLSLGGLGRRDEGEELLGGNMELLAR